MEDNSFRINPDSRMDIKERLLYNILNELISINKKLDNKDLNNINNINNENLIKPYPAKKKG